MAAVSAWISTWYMTADSIRETRNLLAHGCWGILQAVQLVVHVSGHPPETQGERRFSLAQLEAGTRKGAEFTDASLVCDIALMLKFSKQGSPCNRTLAT